MIRRPAWGQGFLLLLAIILLGLARSAWAQDVASPVVGPVPEPGLLTALGLQTSFRVGAWTRDRDLNGETITAIGGMRARVAPRAGAMDAFAEGFVQADSFDGLDADLVEAWLRFSSGALELKAGRQIVVWGRADRLNPTDTISSRDYTLLVAADDEQRRGNLMVQARLGLGDFTLDAYWLPEFRANRFPLDTNRAGVALLPDERPDDKAQFAARIDRSGGTLDWSLSWFHGIDRNRDFVATRFNPPGALVEVQQQFPQLDVFGADVAGNVGRLGYRGEIAYTHVRGDDSIDRKNSNIWAVVGVDTTLANGWNINVQYSFRRILDYADTRSIANPVARAVATLSAAVNNQLDETQNGATVRIAHNWFQDTLDFELAAIVYFETGDAAIRPKLRYAITDTLRISAGADIFLGPALSYFGRVRNLSGGYVQLNFGF